MQCLRIDLVFTNFFSDECEPLCGRTMIRCVGCQKLGCPIHEIKWQTYNYKRSCIDCNNRYLLYTFGYTTEK